MIAALRASCGIDPAPARGAIKGGWRWWSGAWKANPGRDIAEGTTQVAPGGSAALIVKESGAVRFDSPLPALDDAIFRRLVEGVRDCAIFLLAPDGRIASWNRGAQRITQHSAAGAIGRHFSMLYEPQAVAAGWPEEALRQTLQHGRFEDEGWRVRKDGSPYRAHVVVSPLFDGEGGLIGYSKVMRDLGDRRALDEALPRSKRRLGLRIGSV